MSAVKAGLPANVQVRRPLRNIHLVLPAYNEENSLPSLLERCETFRADYVVETGRSITVWIVDDGCTDQTVPLARAGYGELPVEVVIHPQNRGLGQAIRTGLATALGASHPDDAIIIMDADDTHDVNLITKLVEALEAGADIAIASRFVPGGDDSTAPPFRRALSHGAGWVFNMALPLDDIKDFTTGYRAYRASLLSRAVDHYGERLVEETGFAVMVELLLKLRYCNPVVAEVPLVLRYDRKGSDSKLKLWRTIGQYLKLISRDRLSPAPFRTL
jgi:dolichol-phosphate mannosyltransferase